jgi:hypothetical protein
MDSRKTEVPLKPEDRSEEIWQADIFEKQETLVSKLIDRFLSEASDQTAKISIAELIRLLQFQREIAQVRPVDVVEVRWIDPQ